MAFPDLQQTVSLLGMRFVDKVTGLRGVATSVSFDLSGCVQLAINRGLDKDGSPQDSHWIDVQRLEPADETPVMDVPAFGAHRPIFHDKGPMEKPSKGKF